jgi:glycosyltransferase involved in cell wall biosynthesis
MEQSPASEDAPHILARSDPPIPSADDRPGVAIIANSQTPYRLHLHRRIVAEIPEVRLWSVYTHEESNAPWSFTVPPEIHPVSFGRGESSARQGDPRHALHEWIKGGRIIRWLRQQRVAGVVAMGYNDLGRLRIMRWCRRHAIPCFLFGDSNIRGDRARGLKAVAKRAVVSTAVRWCHGVMPCGTLGREYFLKYGARADRVYYFPYEPDYALMGRGGPAASAAAREAAERFGLEPGRRRLVYSGRLAPEKRVDLLIDAFAAIAPGRPDWDLLVIGDGPLRPSLERRVPAQVRARVRWTGFSGEPGTVAALYHNADVLVLPSDYEPWAVVINEAAAAGLAIVASDVVGAAAELVRDGVNGRVFPAGDAAALAGRLFDVTDSANVDRMKAASEGVLADWRARGDPVRGLRRALVDTGVFRPATRGGPG